MGDVVLAKLGPATAALHTRLVAVQDRARGARPAVRRIIRNLLCGAYHDQRSTSTSPKGELLESLRSLPGDAGAQPLVTALIVDVLAGAFADGAPAPDPVPRPARPLTARQAAALAALEALYAARGGPVPANAVATAINVDARGMSDTLAQLVARGAAERVESPLGWIPARKS